jgi:phenylalanyl-tRNA synthetase beta chain
MKISKSWLKELVNIEIETSELSRQLTMAGLEVASTAKAAPDFDHVVVGEVLEVSRHPNADKLSICKVNIGKGHEELTIVCGAKNVKPQMKVPVALVGATLPGDFKIKQSKIRGTDSCGMLCAADELGLSEKSEGILELPSDAPLGVNFRKYLSLDDEILDIELTANRGDCLSVLGVAREVATLNRASLSLPKINTFSVKKDLFPVEINAEDCPHYVGRIIRGVNNKIPTPEWMLRRMRSVNETPISLIVDITNYVMYELGQPLHAFDLSKLDKKIEVRYAKPAESLDLLDGSHVDLEKSSMVIADSQKPIALAGVMGGLNSGISVDTQDIFLESAYFNPIKIAEASRAYKISTDASYRYERGVDFDLQLYAINRATSLILEIAGGTAGEIIEVTSKEHLPIAHKIKLYRYNIQKVLGLALPDKEVTDILSRLGIKLKTVDDGWEATVPSHRAFDIKIEEDLIGNIGRIYGFDHILEQTIIAPLNSDKVTSSKNELDRICNLMEDLGYHEVVTYSFIDEKTQKLLGGDNKPLLLANPLSSEQSVMRTTLWPGLVNVIKHNKERKADRLRVYETGLRFIFDENNLLKQEPTIACAIYGDLYPEQWGVNEKGSPTDFFDLKNDINSLLKLFLPSVKVDYESCDHEALHPARAAKIYVGKELIGLMGEAHPIVVQELKLNRKLYLCELDLSKIIKRLPVVFKEFSIYPRVDRDISIIVDKDVSWSEIKQEIVDISGELLQNIDVFDVYCNENMGLDKKSLAIHLTFQSLSRTLVDKEVQELMDRIILVLKQIFSASLRG